MHARPAARTLAGGRINFAFAQSDLSQFKQNMVMALLAPMQPQIVK
jgi:hypothetical protein